MGAAALIGGSNLAGGLIGTAGQIYANDQNTHLARQQMGFQEYMSNTAHQREVRDLLAAGLNPILSATKGAGASTPNGATTDIKNPTETLGRGIQDAGRAIAIDAARVQNENIMVQANSAKAEAERRNVDADTVLKLQGADRNNIIVQKILADIASIEQSTRTSSALEAKTKEEILNLGTQRGRDLAETKLANARTGLTGAETTNTNVRTEKTAEEVKILKALVPFITEGTDAIRQLINYATKDAPLGKGAADIIEKMRPLVQESMKEDDKYHPKAVANRTIEIIKKWYPQITLF